MEPLPHSKVADVVSVRAFLLMEYVITGSKIDELFANANYAKMIEDDKAMLSFAYWTGDRIVAAYNAIYEANIAKLRTAKKAAQSKEDSDDVKRIIALIGEQEALLIQAREIDEDDNESNDESDSEEETE